MNKREYLRQKGFVVGKRGRFSQEMKDALSNAAAEGIVFDEPVVNPVSTTKTAAVPTKPVIDQPYDAKAVRSWAERNGSLKPGQRGRIPNEIIAAYLADNAPVEKKAKPIEKRTRPENVAYVLDKGTGIQSNLTIAVSKCGRCDKHIGYCACSVPAPPKYLAGMPISFNRPAV